MQLPQMSLKHLALACSIALTACGGGGSGGDSSGGSTTTSTTITGVAEAPGGMVAMFETNTSVLAAISDFVFPGAAAAITGLQPVTGATVELIRIDDDGNQVGDVLASTVTSITGNYSLTLPSGVSLAGNLVVRISGTGGASMSAMVVEQSVDINPISQYVLSKFVDDQNLVLANLAVNEVVALQGKVKEFNLTATADLSTMLAALDAQVGEFVDTEIAVLNSTPDDGSVAAATAGTWNLVQLSFGLHDSEQQDYGTLAMGVHRESISIAAGNTAGTLDITAGSSNFSAWTNFGVDNQGATNIFHETDLNGSTEMLTGMIDANGTITVESPFQEELQTVDTQVDLDGPDYGWRWPPNTDIVRDTGNGNTKVEIYTSAGVRYATVDTNNDGVKDAIDPNAKAGDEVEMGMTLLLKQGSGMSAASLSGDYGIVALSLDLDTAPIGTLESSVGVLGFNSAGTVNIAASAIDNVGVERTASSFTAITLTDTGGTDGNTAFPYAVTSTGAMTLDVDNDAVAADPDDLEGWINNDASVMALLKVTTTGTGTITEARHEMVVGVKLPTSLPNLESSVFKFYPIIFGAEQNGHSELSTLRNSSSFTFNAGATAMTAAVTSRGFERATDIASVQAQVESAQPAFDFTVDSIGTNGAITMSHPDVAEESNTILKGFVSADGKMMVLRVYDTDDTSGSKYRAIGLVIGIRQ